MFDWLRKLLGRSRLNDRPPRRPEPEFRAAKLPPRRPAPTSTGSSVLCGSPDPSGTFSVDPHRLEDLLNYCIGFAKQLIEQHGEFHPFGAVIVPSGTVTGVGGHTGDEHPKGADVYQLLQGAMRAQYLKKEIVAGAITANVNILAQFNPLFSDGIRVLLECAGYSRIVYLPYRISGSGVDYAEFIPVDVPSVICSG